MDKAPVCCDALYVPISLHDFSVTVTLMPAVLEKAADSAAMITSNVSIAARVCIIIAAILIFHAPSPSEHIIISLLRPARARQVSWLILFSLIFTPIARLRCGVPTSAIHDAPKTITHPTGLTANVCITGVFTALPALKYNNTCAAGEIACAVAMR